MQITATARNLQVTDDIRAYLTKRVSKFERILQQVDEVNAVLEESRHRYSLELTLQARRAVFYARAVAGDVFTAIDQVVDKMDQQIRRHKERLNDRRHRHSRREVASQVAEQGEFAEEEFAEEELRPGDIEIERADEYLADKPMAVEEAAMQLHLRPEMPFLAFLNAGTGKLNVVYRKPDGTYRWIEPE